MTWQTTFAVIGAFRVTVNSKIFAGFYFCENAHMGSYVKIKSSTIGEITLSVTEVFKYALVTNY